MRAPTAAPGLCSLVVALVRCGGALDPLSAPIIAPTATGSSLCDSALSSACGAVRGAGAACTACESSFAHQVLLHGAGCAHADLQAFCSPGINLLHARNLTAWHVGPGSADVVDKNTADLGGMLFFELRALGNPVECAEPFLPGTSSPDPTVAFDCTNREAGAGGGDAGLLISQLTLTVDDRFGDYAFCNLCYKGYDPYGHGPTSLNPIRCSAGAYVCDCQHRGLGAANCNGTVGQLAVGSFFTSLKPGSFGTPTADWKWWEYNAAQRTQGFWWSTLADGACVPAGGGARRAPWCAWQVARVDRTVAKSCHSPRFAQSIESFARQRSQPDAACFDACLRTGGARNTSSPCWIRCMCAFLCQHTHTTAAAEPHPRRIFLLSDAFPSTERVSGACLQTMRCSGLARRAGRQQRRVGYLWRLWGACIRARSMRARLRPRKQIRHS